MDGSRSSMTPIAADTDSQTTGHGVSEREAFRIWLRVGLNSFGGPAGQISVMHRILVEEKRWISERRFLHALNYCMLLPGPEAQQLATYVGWLMHRTRGGILAGGLFIVFGAALIGFLGDLAGFPAFRVGGGHGGGNGKDQEALVDSLLGDELPEHARPTVARSLRASAVWLALWLVPVVALLVTLGPSNVFSQIAVFFSKMALVTFGGAYAVLAYVAQEAVEHYHWLKPGEMLDGLGMAETTPGPLIMVLQFVGFMAAYRDPGTLSPMLAGTFGGLLATWVTFTPCFLWIFLGAPFVEVLRENKPLNAALSALTAAVVGVVLNLAIWFAIHTIFREVWPVRGFGLAFEAPVLASVNAWALALSVAAAVAIFRLKLGMIPTLAGCCAAGIALYLVGAIG